MEQITVKALIENVAKVTSFIDGYLESIDCPIKAMMQIDVAIDEIFSNIVYYAYDDSSDGDNEITVKLETLREQIGVKISFIDRGKQYNPLEKDDPDVKLSAEERNIGGLGIYIVKKTMDETSYEYLNNQNIFSIIKYF